jgi:hypothetical protein
MKHERDIQPIELPARALHSLADAKGSQITVTKGVVWVTQANDNRDMILSRGQSFIIDRDGLTVAFALRDAAFITGPAADSGDALRQPFDSRLAGASYFCSVGIVHDLLAAWYQHNE